MYHNQKRDLDYALAFTRVYQSESEPSLRELKCLQMQIPYVLEPMEKDDLLAGHMAHGYVGFSPQYGGSYTYFYWDDRVEAAIEAVKAEVDAAYLAEVQEMRRFWKKENTEQKVKNAFAEKYNHVIPEGVYYYATCRIAGMNVDLSLLVDEGLCGLKQRIAAYREKNGDTSFYQALSLSVDVLADACLQYAENADRLAQEAEGERRRELLETAEILKNIAVRAPQTFKEALQLIWIYTVCSDLMNFGRLDQTLGDFYVRDMESGILTEEEAIQWLSSFYRHIIRVSKVHDSRIIIGGLGRKNPEAADRLAFALIETSRRVMDVVPQLTLRYYHGMNEELMDRSLENIAQGAVYPIIYSDDTTVPAIEKIYGVDHAMACNWVPLGCGEYIIEGYGAATPNTGATLPQALDVLLHNGYNSFTKVREAELLSDASAFQTFDELFSAYTAMMEKACDEMAYHEQLNYEIAGENASYLHLSLLVHDCVEKNKPIFAGGCRYLCATSEIFGLITFADSLSAIKKRVFDEKRFTLAELVRMIDCNFEGYEKERQLLLSAPKYGNDDDEADDMAVKVFNHISELHQKAGRDTSLYGYHIVSVNNSGSAERGAVLSATPCGRLSGQALSNGNSPSLNADHNGLTATLNSMAKFDPTRHVGVVHNIRFNKDLLQNNMEKIKLLLEVFYENNGVQTNLSSIGKDDLEQAMLHPERYQNLLVRIGGFSARFVELSPIVQQELLLRTTYEAC